MKNENDLEHDVQQAMERVGRSAAERLERSFSGKQVKTERFAVYFSYIRELQRIYTIRVDTVINAGLPQELASITLAQIVSEYTTAVDRAVDIVIRHGKFNTLHSFRTPMSELADSVHLLFEVGRTVVNTLTPKLYKRSEVNFNDSSSTSMTSPKPSSLPEISDFRSIASSKRQE